MAAYKVIVLGDSVPRGYNSGEPYGWPHLLDEHTDDTVTTYELGVVGETLADLPNRAVDEVRPRASRKEWQETVVIVHSGHNDVQGNETPKTSLSMFKAMVRRLEGLLDDASFIDRTAFVGLVPPVTGQSITVSSAERERAAEYDEQIETTVSSPYLSLRNLEWNEYSADGIHPTCEGQERIARRVAETLF